MIPRDIYLQYVGDSDDEPSDSDDIRDADITWSRERIFKHDILYTISVASNPTRQDADTAEASTQEKETCVHTDAVEAEDQLREANDRQGE